FAVLTKFDRRFEEAKGKADSSEERWSAAIQTSLTSFFASGRDNWVEEWRPGTPFNNCFWLRNPNFIAPGLMRYTNPPERRELGVLEPERIGQFKREYLDNKEVGRHFHDPERSWEEAFKLNDGGISFIANSLFPVCRPELKRQQIE